jgi:hypothetical protein
MLRSSILFRDGLVAETLLGDPRPNFLEGEEDIIEFHIGFQSVTPNLALAVVAMVHHLP